MRMSEKGLLFLMELEGVVLVPYRDSVGVWTIGVGHTAKAGKPDPMTLKQITMGDALKLFRKDIQKYEKVVSAFLSSGPTRAKPHEFDALVSFHFNTGAIAKAKVAALFKAGDRKRAAQAFMNWTRAGSNATALLSRRLQEQKLFATGDYGEPFDINVWTTWPGKGKKVRFRMES